MEGEEAVAADSGGAGGGDGESSSASDHERKQRNVLGSAAAAEELPVALSRPIRNARLRSFLPSHYSIYGMPSRKAKAKAKAGKNRRGSMKECIAKILRPPSHRNNIDTSTLRRSTRKRRLSVSLYDSFSDGEDDILRHTYRAKSDEHVSASTKKSSSAVPRREGLRPRTSQRVVRHEESSQEFEDVQDTSEDEDAGEDGEDEDEQETGEGEEEGEGDGEGDEDGEEDGEEEEEDEEIGEREGRRRYELRNRTEVQRFSPKRDDRQLRSRSPQKVFHSGTDVKHSREVRRSGSRPHKRHHRADDSDDSLLVDEMDQGPGVSWGRGARGPHPFLPATLDMHGSTNWGLGIAASGWGHQGDYWGFGLAGTGTQTAGASSKGGADIQPVQVDDTVNFDQVGGLSHYIDSLKEMVFFPLLYPKFFENYHITPPRGVLLCGPPGTGKTLVARALASAAGKAGQKVSFYMRKGADVLSKWVGEAERQLRMLFEEAQRCQPSIIFFDEIDGLAPVRSSKSEQIHNSIVSTLLALMDGLDSRGQVVVIGATNRIDAIDGALRRPGRFDREFIFPLPDSEARAEILDIHTRRWHRPPAEDLRKELSASCVGYCGADLKALCTEAAIRAFRERYPQVYRSDEQFVIDADSIKVQKSHFYEAMSAITPAAHRGAIVHSRPLPTMLAACLQGQLQTIVSSLSNIFPLINKVTISPDCDDDESPENLSRLFGLQNGVMFPLVYKPRYLLCGIDGSGLEHLGPALLHELERLPVHSLGLPSLLSDPSAKTPEEALVHIFGEARRNTPSILYLPQFHLWWETAHDQLRTVLLMLLTDLPPNLPVLFLGTSSVPKNELDQEAISVFGRHIYEVQLPSPAERDQFFSQIIRSLLTTSSQKVTARPKKNTEVEDLPKAPKAEKGPSEAELRAQADAEEHVIRRLRMCLRDVCNRLLYEKRFSIFHFPVEAEEVPDYYTVVKNPMDVATLLQRVDNGHYMTRSSFMQDVELIPANAKLYHGEDYHTAARIVSKACALRDAVQGMLSQMDPEMVAYCERIASQGGPMKLATAAPADSQDIQAGPPKMEGGSTGQPASVTRVSARLRGVQADLNVSEAVRKPRISNEGIPPGDGATSSLVGDDVQMQECDNESLMVEVVLPTPSPDPPELSNLENSDEKSNHVPMEVAASPKPSTEEEDASESEEDGISAEQLEHEISDLKVKLLLRTEDSTVSELEMLYARICKMLQLHHQRGAFSRSTILKSLQTFVEDDSNFQL